jgi:hypothetical protein
LFGGEGVFAGGYEVEFGKDLGWFHGFFGGDG